MADNVRYVLDKMAPLFKQLEEMEIFSSDEIKSIVKRRTDFEYTLKRRQLVPADFSQYVTYEIALDKLCNSRSKHYLASSKENIQKVKNIQASFIRHITYIFERAIRRFSDEVYLWMDFINFLKSKGSNSILNTVYARALALHPKNEDFWIECAMHEVEANTNVHAARTILQRGIRANTRNKNIWLKYFELELWNAVRIIERQRKLGLEVTLGIIDEGAPLVVFKHAMEALSNNGDNIESILQMHTASEGILGSLSEAMEDALREKFSTNVALWRHLMRTQVDRMLFNNKNLSGSTRALEKKRKFRLEHCDVESAAEKCAAAISQPIGLLLEASDAFASFTDDNDEALPLSGDFLLMAVRGLDETVLKCNQSMAYAVRFADRLKAAEEKKAAASSSSKSSSAAAPAKKARKGKKSEPEPEPVVEENLEKITDDNNDDENEEMEDGDCEEPTIHTPYVVKETGKRQQKKSAKELLTRPLEEVNDRLKEFSSAAVVDKVSDPLAAAELRNAILLAQHHLWLFASRVHVPLTGAVTTASLIGAIPTAAGVVKKHFQTHNAPGVHKTSLNQLVESWIQLVQDALHSEQLTAAQRSDLTNTVISLAAIVASNEEAGGSLLSQIIREAVDMQQLATIQQVYQGIIGEPSMNSSSNQKGVWCAKYLQSVLDYHSKSGAAAAEEEGVRAAYQWVLATVQRAPQLFVGVDLSHFFSGMINYELNKVKVRVGSLGCSAEEAAATTAATSLKKSNGLSVAKEVTSKAIALCGGDSCEFAQVLIELERLSGHHQAANHLAWKIGKGTL